MTNPASPAAPSQFLSDLQNKHRRYLPLRSVPLVSAPGARSPMRTLAVIEQFRVSAAARYAPAPRVDTPGTDTFCNIFLWDFTAAMGAEIPHWVDARGEPAAPGNGNRETRANELVDRLQKGAWGWRPCSQESAHAQATLGLPVVAGWKNGLGGPGHVAVVMPVEGALRLAQAGAVCGERMTLVQCFGTRRVLFWWHP